MGLLDLGADDAALARKLEVVETRARILHRLIVVEIGDGHTVLDVGGGELDVQSQRPVVVTVHHRVFLGQNLAPCQRLLLVHRGKQRDVSQHFGGGVDVHVGGLGLREDGGSFSRGDVEAVALPLVLQLGGVVRRRVVRQPVHQGPVERTIVVRFLQQLISISCCHRCPQPLLRFLQRLRVERFQIIK